MSATTATTSRWPSAMGPNGRCGGGSGGASHRLDAEIDNLYAALAGRSVGPALNGRSRCAGARLVLGMRIATPTPSNGLTGRCASPAPKTTRRCASALSASRLPRCGRSGAKPEQAATLVEATTIAREVGDLDFFPERSSLTRATLTRARPDVVDALADEALYWATAAGDEWQIALACETKARRAPTAVELRDWVERAVSLLEGVGNIYYLGLLLINAEWVALNNGDDRDAMDFAERARPVVRELDSPAIWMWQHGNLGLASLFMGDTETARDAFGEELRLHRELVFRARVRRPPGPRRGRRRPRRRP